METIPITEELKERARRELAGTPVLFAYVFGSQVTGHADAESDVDVAFFFDPQLPKKDRFDVLLNVAARAGTALGLGINSRGVDPVCLNEAPLLLRYVAMNEGLLLYERNHVARVAFELDVLQQRDDEKYYRRAYRQEFFRRLAAQPPSHA